MENHAAVWTPRISTSRRAWTCRALDGSLRIDVNGAPRTVGRDQYTVPTRYGTSSGARRPDPPWTPNFRRRIATTPAAHAVDGSRPAGVRRPGAGTAQERTPDGLTGKSSSPGMRVASASAPVR